MIDLHDAVLEELRLDYRTGDVLVVFATADGNVHLTAHGMYMLRAPRREPWGQGGSHCVNKVNGPGPIYFGHRSAVIVEIELQSGDLLEIEAQEILIAPATA